MTRRIAVFGASGHGKVVADVARTAGFDLVAFIDDAPGRQPIWEISVISWEAFLADSALRQNTALALGIGDNAARERCARRIAEAGVELPALVHPRATVAATARLGAGTLVMAGGIVNPDASVAQGCIVNTGAVVEHDCRLGAFVHLSPNAALGGNVTIGDRTHIGLGAVALPGVRIGADVRVGAGAVVNRDIPNRLTVVGVPARPIDRNAK